MPPMDFTNPEIIKFLADNFEKTTRLTLQWNQRYKDLVQAAGTLHRESKNINPVDVLLTDMKGGLAATVRDYEASAFNRRKRRLSDRATTLGISNLRKDHSIVALGLGDPAEDPELARPDTDLRAAPVMRPVKPEHTAILYNDKPVYGREVYLKTRNRIKPEDKYYLARTSGWLYGWRMNDSLFGKGQRRCGRVYRLMRDMGSRRGPDTKNFNAICSGD